MLNNFVKGNSTKSIFIFLKKLKHAFGIVENVLMSGISWS
jgi:hypothetical protein